jgi:hypothetical protein
MNILPGFSTPKGAADELVNKLLGEVVGGAFAPKTLVAIHRLAQAREVARSPSPGAHSHRRHAVFVTQSFAVALYTRSAQRCKVML